MTSSFSEPLFVGKKLLPEILQVAAKNDSAALRNFSGNIHALSGDLENVTIFSAKHRLEESLVWAIGMGVGRISLDTSFGKSGLTPLMAACEGHPDSEKRDNTMCAQLLLSSGANPLRTRTMDNATALHFAVFSNLPNLVGLLVRYESKLLDMVTTQSFRGLPANVRPLQWAESLGFVDVIDAIKKGLEAPFDRPKYVQANDLYFAKFARSKPLRMKVSPNPPDTSAPTVMLAGVYTRSLIRKTDFKNLQVHANLLFEVDDLGRTALHNACLLNRPSVLAFLLEKISLPDPAARKAFLDATDDAGSTAVSYCVGRLVESTDDESMKFHRERLACLQLLVEAGADINIPNQQLESPLISAVETNNMEAVKYLLGRPECNVCYVKPVGGSALSIATAMGKDDMAGLISNAVTAFKRLQLRGAGCKTLHSIINDNDVEALKSFMGDIAELDAEGRNALEVAASRRHAEQLAWLVNNTNLDVNGVNKRTGVTPLIAACMGDIKAEIVDTSKAFTGTNPVVETATLCLDILLPLTTTKTLNFRDTQSGFTAVQWLAHFGDVDGVKRIIQRGDIELGGVSPVSGLTLVQCANRTKEGVHIIPLLTRRNNRELIERVRSQAESFFPMYTVSKEAKDALLTAVVLACQESEHPFGEDYLICVEDVYAQLMSDEFPVLAEVTSFLSLSVVRVLFENLVTLGILVPMHIDKKETDSPFQCNDVGYASLAPALRHLLAVDTTSAGSVDFEAVAQEVLKHKTFCDMVMTEQEVVMFLLDPILRAIPGSGEDSTGSPRSFVADFAETVMASDDFNDSARFRRARVGLTQGNPFCAIGTAVAEKIKAVVRAAGEGVGTSSKEKLVTAAVKTETKRFVEMNKALQEKNRKALLKVAELERSIQRTNESKKLSEEAARTATATLEDTKTKFAATKKQLSDAVDKVAALSTELTRANEAMEKMAAAHDVAKAQAVLEATRGLEQQGYDKGYKNALEVSRIGHQQELDLVLKEALSQQKLQLAQQFDVDYAYMHKQILMDQEATVKIRIRNAVSAAEKDFSKQMDQLRRTHEEEVKSLRERLAVAIAKAATVHFQAPAPSNLDLDLL